MRTKPSDTQPKEVVLNATFPWWLSPCKKSKWYQWFKNPAIWLDKRPNWPHPTKSSSLRCYLPLMVNSMQKNWYIIDSFQRYWWSKNDAFWWKSGTTDHTRPKLVAWDPIFPNKTNGLYQIETSQLIWNANKLTSFYLIKTITLTWANGVFRKNS